jgi:hypothetical protein
MGCIILIQTIFVQTNIAVMLQQRRRVRARVRVRLGRRLGARLGLRLGIDRQLPVRSRQRIFILFLLSLNSLHNLNPNLDLSLLGRRCKTIHGDSGTKPVKSM